MHSTNSAIEPSLQPQELCHHCSIPTVEGGRLGLERDQERVESHPRPLIQEAFSPIRTAHLLHGCLRTLHAKGTQSSL